MPDTTKLRELAQQATPGPWIGCGPAFGEALPRYLNDVVVDREGDDDDGESVCRAPLGLDEIATNDMEFIAAANPEVVLEILNELALLEFDLASARQIIEHQNARIAELEAVKIAAQNLAKVRGRHHSEQAMNKLLEALK